MTYSPPFEIPKVPGLYVEFNNTVYAPDPAVPHRAVVIGTKLSSGSGTALTPYRVRSKAEGDGFFGQGSMVAEMARAFLASSSVELWAVGIAEEAGGVKAAGAITFAGTATASGAVVFLVGGHRIRVPYALGDADTDIVDTLVAAAAELPDLPCAIADDDDAVTVTANWKGASGNDIDVRLDPDPSNKAPPGITVTITALSGGATDPEIDEALTALGDTKYDTIAVGYRDTTNIGHADVFLAARWGALVQKEGVAFFAHPGSYGTLTTLAGNLNSQFVVVVASGPSPTPPWAWAAEVASVDAEITQKDPNRPRLGVVLQYCKPPAQSAVFTFDERNTLLNNGISTATRTANATAQVERLVTTYTQNGDGFDDRSYYDIIVVRTLGRLRFELQVFRSRYKDWKIAADEALAVNPKVMTVSKLRQALGGLYTKWMGLALVQDMAFFTINLVVEVAENGEGFTTFIPVKLVRPLHVISGEVAFV